jgi:hypothetical protein
MTSNPTGLLSRSIHLTGDPRQDPNISSFMRNAVQNDKEQQDRIVRLAATYRIHELATELLSHLLDTLLSWTFPLIGPTCSRPGPAAPPLSPGDHMRALTRLLATLAILTAVHPTAHADSYSYAFTDTTDAPLQTFFTYISPTLITTTTTFVPLTCMVDSTACTDVMFVFDPGSTVDPAEIAINAPTVGIGDYFNSTAFLTTLGTNTAFDDRVTLTINDLSPVSPMPEPSSLVLLATGVLGMAKSLRRKFSRR